LSSYEPLAVAWTSTEIDLLLARVREAIERALISAAVTGKIDVRWEAA